MADANTMVDVYLLEHMYSELEKAVGKQSIGPANIVTIAALAMAVVERQTNMSGADKKAMVIALLHKLTDEINKRDITPEDRAALHILIDATVPAAIDTLVDATKGGLDINQIKSKWSKLKCC